MKLALLLFGSVLASAQSQNENIITLIPTTNSSGVPTATGQFIFRDLSVPAHTAILRAPPAISADYSLLLPASMSAGCVDATLVSGTIWQLSIAGCSSALPVPDSTIITQSAADPTKQMRFDDSLITTGNMRVLQLQDANYQLAGTNITNTFTSNQIFNAATLILEGGSGIVFDIPLPGSGSISLHIPGTGATTYALTFPGNGGAVNDVAYDIDGAGTMGWTSWSSLMPVPLSFTFGGAGAGLFVTATTTSGNEAIEALNTSASGYGMYTAATGTNSFGIYASASNTGSQAGRFLNDSTTSSTIAAVFAENDAGGTGQGLAMESVGSLLAYGGNASNRLLYDAVANTLNLGDVSGDSVNMTAANMLITGTTATNSSYGVINSSGYQAYLGFLSASVPALSGGTTGAPVAFPLPSNTPTATWVLTGNGPGVATSWQPATSGVTSVGGASPITSTGGATPTIGCSTCLVTGGGQTITGGDTWTAAQIFSGGIGSDLTPNLNNIYKLGARTANYWSELNVNNIFAFTNINVQTGTINMNYGTSGPGVEVIDASGDWVGPNVGTTGTPVTQIYATTIGSSGHPVTNITATHVTDVDLATGATYCVEADSTGKLLSFNDVCGNASYPGAWNTWTPFIGGCSSSSTTVARYKAFGKNVNYTTQISCVSNGTQIIINNLPITASGSGAFYFGEALIITGGTSTIGLSYVQSSNTLFLATVPFTPTTGLTYTVYMSGVYESN